jgi:hypothetical protein
MTLSNTQPPLVTRNLAEPPGGHCLPVNAIPPSNPAAKPRFLAGVMASTRWRANLIAAKDDAASAVMAAGRVNGSRNRLAEALSPIAFRHGARVTLRMVQGHCASGAAPVEARGAIPRSNRSATSRWMRQAGALH